MEKSVEATGKTFDEAVANALGKLNVDRDSVSVEVLEKGKSGFLGIGGTLTRVRVSYTVDRSERASNFLEGLIMRMGMTAKISCGSDENGNLSFELVGENMGALIGRRGETLEALQHLTGYVANKDEETGVRVTVDAENYRAKREEALIQLAKRSAEKAVKYRRNIPLEPMNAYARHVIHAALQDNKLVTTYSTGVDPNRRVVISVPGGERYQQRGTDSGRPFETGNRQQKKY